MCRLRTDLGWNQTYRELQELSFHYINPGVTPCCRRQSNALGAIAAIWLTAFAQRLSRLPMPT